MIFEYTRANLCFIASTLIAACVVSIPGWPTHPAKRVALAVLSCRAPVLPTQAGRITEINCSSKITLISILRIRVGPRPALFVRRNHVVFSDPQLCRLVGMRVGDVVVIVWLFARVETHFSFQVEHSHVLSKKPGLSRRSNMGRSVVAI